MDLSPIVVEPVTAHSHTVVFLHGRGDNATQFSSSLAYSRDSSDRSLIEAFPSFRWVFPQAPLRSCAAMSGIMRQWFDVWNVKDFADREELQVEGLREMVPLVRDILAEEAARLGGRWDKVVLAGISMGAATSVHTLINLDVPEQGGGRLGAFLGFSCRCPFSGRSLAGMREVLALGDVPQHDHVLRNTPVLLEHCVDDPLVPVANGQAMKNTLEGFGARVEWRAYPKGGHWFHDPDGMDDAVQFLKKYVVGEAFKGSAMDLS